MKDPSIVAIREAYVRKIIETVGNLDNVLYEVANESAPYSTEWQYHMTSFVRSYEATKSERHPIGMTYQATGGFNATLFSGPADWIAPGTESGGYKNNPAPADGRKIVIADTDHLGGPGFGRADLIWKSFTRGLHTLFMDRYVPYDSVSYQPFVNAQEIRKAMGYTRQFTDKIDLRSMTPRPELASSGYALASHREMLAYFPIPGKITVDLSNITGPLQVEWFQPSSGKFYRRPSLEGGRRLDLDPPFPGTAEIHVCARKGSPQTSSTHHADQDLHEKHL